LCAALSGHGRRQSPWDQNHNSDCGGFAFIVTFNELLKFEINIKRSHLKIIKEMKVN